MVHWLEIGGIHKTLEQENQQLKALRKYCINYPMSEVTFFNKYSGDTFAKVVRLECSQPYETLDLDCNSGFDDSIKRLSHKPKNIEICKMQRDYFFERV